MNNGYNNICKTSVLRNGIKVMVIHHNQDFLESVSDFLKCHAFEVTCVHQAGVALRMLMENKDKFDLLLIASDMRDVDTITFLRLMKSMDILSIVMSDKTDDNFLLEVIENGGFRVVKTPLTDDVVMHARQDVIRARFRKFEQFKMSGESETTQLESESCQDRRQDGNATRKNVMKRNTRGIAGITDPQLLESARVKKRVCIQWTKELHSIFLRAIYELGEGKCFPKDILDAMGVPGLTRLQVASHLQKCRLDVLKILQKKGKSCSSSNKRSLSSKDIRGLATHVENHDQIVTNIDAACPSNGGQSDVNNQSVTDFSVMNGFRFENLGEVYSGPTDHSDHSSFPPNEISDDFFDILNDKDANPSLACIELDVPGPNYNYISEQMLPHYDDQVMAHQGTSEFNHQI